jgi:glycosyltransferase involved in cell wall biosynthesis
MRTLYVSYFGIQEPLVQTQVLPYLRELAARGVRMALLTFEPDMKKRWDRNTVTEWQGRLLRDGIDWHVLPYHKRPSLLVTVFDVVAGALYVVRLARRERIDIIHGRSHVGAAIGALAKRFAGARLIFDIRGLLAEEYASSGNWSPAGIPFRLTKAMERWLWRRADGFVVLTEAGKKALFPNGAGGRPIEVIPCCVGPAHFASDKADLGIGERVVFVYAGTLGGNYLVRETAQLLGAARQADPRVFALVLSDNIAIASELEREGFSTEDYLVMSVPPEDVPKYLRAADVGVLLLRPSDARRTSSPTKFAEYLAARLPVIFTAGIGDLDSHIGEAHAGVLLRRHDAAALAQAVSDIAKLRRDPKLRDRCRALARRRYDLETVGGPRYRRLYENVMRHRIRVLALASYPVQAASSRFRVVQLMKPLAERGISVTFSPFLTPKQFAHLYNPGMLVGDLPRIVLAVIGRMAIALRAARADVVFVQREAMLVGPPVVEWIATRILRRPMILDLDDATYIAYDSPVYGRLAQLLKWQRKTKTLIKWSSTVTCGNEGIADHVRSLATPAVVVPNMVDGRVFRPRTSQSNDPTTVGWIGTHSTYPFFQRLIPILEQLACSHDFRVLVVGAGGETKIRGVDVESRPWALERDAEDFRSLDIGVYPIPDDSWGAGKSGLKAVQYMSCGVPFVMSPVGVCATMGIARVTHFPATTDEDWFEALHRLLEDGLLRRRMGAAGRAFAEKHYTIDEQADRLAAVIRTSAAQRP